MVLSFFHGTDYTKAKAGWIITGVMTVEGQKNHYNVKLLKGYGVSINPKYNRLCLKGGCDPFTREQQLDECPIVLKPFGVQSPVNVAELV